MIERRSSRRLDTGVWMPAKEVAADSGYEGISDDKGYGVPNGIRTRVATLKGWCPRPD